MSPATAPPAPGLDALTRGLAGKSTAAPPIERWNPAFCGDIDMRIAADGIWFYGGTPIGRPALVKLFASVLRREEERFVLVTPVEKVGILVEDAPFQAVSMTRRGADLVFGTNVGDEVTAGAGHPLRFERAADDGLVPYLLVRDALWARLSRPLLHDLVAIGTTRPVDGTEWFGVASSGVFFPVMTAQELEALS